MLHSFTTRGWWILALFVLECARASGGKKSSDGITWGLIYNRCVRAKNGLEMCNTPLSKHKLGFYKKKYWRGNVHTFRETFDPAGKVGQERNYVLMTIFIQLFRIWKPSNTITCQRKIHAWVIVLLPIKHITKNKKTLALVFNVHQGASTSPTLIEVWSNSTNCETVYAVKGLGWWPCVTMCNGCFSCWENFANGWLRMESVSGTTRTWWWLAYEPISIPKSNSHLQSHE